MQGARGGVWVNGQAGLPSFRPGGRADCGGLAAVPRPSFLSGGMAGTAPPRLQTPAAPGRDKLGGVPRGKFRSGVKSSTPEAEPLQTESNPLGPEPFGGSSSLRVPASLRKELKAADGRTPRQVSSDGVAAGGSASGGRARGRTV